MSENPRTEITVDCTLRGKLADTLIREAKKRKREPVELFADIVEAVLGDNIVDAVLDDTQAAA